ncbi:uncharacterized protein KRP23_8426 [Phytophthora ramorum]|uniref:uncharacterized protein n=1 Tax=Phytophthora ramorum TaxID=164328 RepID=UPI0030B187CB|nr:hypothetical protein KRP23_8426 [Phytophthora ramorum]
MIDSNAVDNLSEISDSDSGVSSLGFAVQLNLVAGTTRRRKGGDGRREAPVRAASQQTKCADATTSADDLDNEDNVSDRSFASSSSMSMDAHFNYLSSMTSAVGKSLPLHLRLPAVIFGKKDMTKPPVPIAWSASSESSIASASELDPIEAVERGFAFDRSKTSRSNSSRSESLLEEQQGQRKMNWQVRGSDSSAGSHQSKALDESSYSESTDESEKAERVTFKDIKEKVAMLPPPPLGSLDMTQPPAPLKNLEHSFAGSLSSSEQSSEGFQSSERRQTRDHDRRPYEDEDERKSGGSSSGSDESSRSNDSSSSSFASSRRQSMKKAEKIVIPVKKTRSNNDGDSDGDEAGKEMSLAEAFKRRHPSFGHRVESHHDKLKRHRDQQQQQRQQEPEQKTPATRDTKKSEAAAPAADPLPPEQQELLDRLATGSRAKISSREMKERSRRLYHQLPEVVERKRQEEVMRRRRERLNELREQEKERRLQQKQR